MYEIQTRDLTLTPIESQDFDWFLRFNRSTHVRTFLWDDEIIPENLVHEIIQTNDQLFKERAYGLWKASSKSLNIDVGYGGLWHFFEEPQPQLLYAIDGDHACQGLGTQLGQAIIKYSFETLGYSYLIASMDEDHSASSRLAQKLRMSWVETKLMAGKLTAFYRLNNPSI